MQRIVKKHPQAPDCAARVGTPARALRSRRDWPAMGNRACHARDTGVAHASARCSGPSSRTRVLMGSRPGGSSLITDSAMSPNATCADGLSTSGWPATD